MSKRYTGNFISGTPQVPTLSSNNGIFDTNDVYTAVRNGAWQEPDGIYEIPRSLRFRQSASAYLNRTPSTAGNRSTWTYSGWIKRGLVTTRSTLIGGYTGTANGALRTHVIILDDNTLQINSDQMQTATDFNIVTNQVFRDPAAWYHIVVAFDTTQSISTNRIKLFVNGAGVSNFSSTSYPSQNYQGGINATNNQFVGRYYDSANPSYYNDCYFSEINFIDGQALDASYFGYFDPVTNIWQPKKYTGTYGTNGFYLPFTEPVATSGTVNSTNLGRNFAGGTNYIRYSQDGSQTANGYVYERASNTVNNTTAPDGTTTGNKLTSDGTASQTHRFYCSTAATPAGSTQTTSIYLKYVNCRYVNIENWNGTSFQTQTFDVLNGVPAASGVGVAASGFTYQFVGNGWYRVSVPLYHGSGNVASPSIALYLCDASGNVTWNGDSTSAVYWWGAQLNLGTTADPYFKTASSTTITNDWTPNNFSVTAGTTYDSMVDSPTNVFTTATDIGGLVSGNYCTLNPLSNGNTLSNANTKAVTGSNTATLGTLAVSSGKWYYEATFTTAGGSFPFLGIIPSSYHFGSGTASWAGSTVACWVGNGAFANGDVGAIAFDLDSLTFTAYKNGVALGSTYYGNNVGGSSTIASGYTWVPIISGVSSTIEVNFGQRPFAYTPPAGYKSLNTTNLQAVGAAAVGNAGIPGSKNMDAVYWYGIGRDNTGNGSNSDYNITGLSFKPDMIWTKNLDSSEDHYIFDSARGFSAYTQISFNKGNSTGLEGSGSNIGTIGTQKVTYISKANNNGFTISQASATGNGGELNYPGRLYDSWCWKQATGVFTMVTYSGNGANRSITHNLGATPAFMIVKGRDNTGGGSSWVYHKSYSSAAAIDRLDSVAAPGANGNNFTGVFNSTAPTSSNFSVGTSTDTNGSGFNYIAYLWAEVPGFSKFGSYTGNGAADGPFVYCGFRPKFIIIRSISNTAPNNRDWLLKTAKNNYNGWSTSDYKGGAQAIIAAVAYTGASGYSDFIDYTSNGFKIKNAGSPNYNGGGEIYMYCAWADNPFALNNRAF